MSVWEWPRLEHVSVVFNPYQADLSNTEMGILFSFIDVIAGQCVYTYTEPSKDPRFPNDLDRICRAFRCSPNEWREAWPALKEFIDDDGICLRLIDMSCIKLMRPTARKSLAADVKEVAVLRDMKRCVYCGDERGPFDFDHLWPVSRGGSDKPNNIVLACARCNRSKGAKTLVEWMCERVA